MRNSRFRSITAGAGLAVLLLSLVVAMPSHAAEPAFPPGSRIGLVPPTGMVISDAFAGFADPEKNAAILIATLPAAAYSQLDKTLDSEELRKQGISLEKREPMRLDAGKGFLLTGRQVAGKERYRKWLLVLAAGDITALVSVQVPESDTAYPNNILRAALATLAVRQKVPEQEQLGLLPFTVGDLAGFRVDAVLPGRALVLSAAAEETPKDASKESKEAPKEPAEVSKDSNEALKDTSKEAPKEPKEAKDSKEAPKETSKEASKTPKEAKDSKETAKDSSKEAAARSFDARLLIAAAPGGPAEADDRGSFARTSFAEIGGIRDVRITMSEPLRIGGQSGYQTMAEAKDTRSGADVMVVQWLRFGSGGFLQMTGIARADAWTSTLSRLRAVRDSVQPK
jgi:outer membrane biosynthesis protein TonB